MSSVFRFEIVPSSPINFGINHLQIAEPGTFPVEFMDFTATTSDNDVHLAWKTAWEVNNHYFAVERSADGESFSEISRVMGSGTSDHTNAYTFSDYNAPQGNLVYRLRQVDFDGQYKYSSQVEVNITDEPVMAHVDQDDRKLHLTANADWEVTLLDLQGREIMRFPPGTKEAALPQLASGLYLVAFRSALHKSFSQKVMIR